MNHLYKKAIIKADEIREQLGLNMFQALNIYDVCLSLDISVRFVDINMEGMYIKQEGGIHPTILLSNQRPFSRRCFTCAHELGHHVFEHGFKVDALSDGEFNCSNDVDEFLVDSFAGALLMPVAGIQTQFAKRKWLFQRSSPVDYYTISSTFGTGYQTLITHCKVNGLISESKAAALLRHTPATLLKSIFSSKVENSFFKIIDTCSQLRVIDLEVSNYIIMPKNVQVEGDSLQKIEETGLGSGYIALKPGIVQAASDNGAINSFIRIQNKQYVGLSEYRHLENFKD